MDEQYIINKMNDYLHRAKELLGDWLCVKLGEVNEDWWNECVLDRLSIHQKKLAIEKGYKELLDFNLAVLLRIADKNWYNLRGYENVPVS